MTRRYTAAQPGTEGIARLTKEQARSISEQEDEVRWGLSSRRQQDVTRSQRAVTYDPSLPNHFFHDSMGDPDTCREDHNHPGDVGEGQ
jgi:hypothetical protein